ncbi:MAG: hypothetical protein LQ340_005807 [Diploschistes diacapsis]|nr:MAG: hypothetical protein LQ340_005807 [Diploschistes diacapsis]
MSQGTTQGAFLPSELIAMVFEHLLDIDSDYLEWDTYWDQAVSTTTGRLENIATHDFAPNVLLALNKTWRRYVLTRVLTRTTWTFTDDSTLNNFILQSSVFVPDAEALITKLWLKIALPETLRPGCDVFPALRAISRNKLMSNLKHLTIVFDCWSGRALGGSRWHIHADYDPSDELFQKILEELRRVRVPKATVSGLKRRELEEELEQCMMQVPMDDDPTIQDVERFYEE